jgi:hypothetical protein
MKKLTITRGTASYKTRGLDNIFEREAQMQEDCMDAIKAVIEQVDSKTQAEEIAKILMLVSAATHSDLERVLRQHGKKEVTP